MSLKKYNPTTSSRRSLIQVDKSSLWKGKPCKKLTVGLSKSSGRNNYGRITSRHRGGGHKRSYRIIDFKRNKIDIAATVERIEYDPNRTAFIALLRYDDGDMSYILAPHELKKDSRIVSSDNAEIKPGNCLSLSAIPLGTRVHNIEMKVGKGGQIIRSAGGFATVMSKDFKYAQLRLPSGEVRMIHLDCKATIGILSNVDKKNESYAKAGRIRWLGFRPVVRGVAMNPVDHPHGGGEGKTSGGRHPVTPWGKLTKGKKTRKNRVTSKFIVRRR